MIEPVHMTDRVHPVAQGHVLNVKLVVPLNVEAAHAAILRAASNSPVALAAAVMMSRFPE